VDKKLELLARVPLFSGLGKAGLAQVAKLADEIDLPAGKQLLQQGDHPHEFFLIVDGSVRIDRDGAQINTLGPGDFLGEIALLDGGQRSATATAVTPVSLLILGQREFNTLLNDYPDIRASVITALARLAAAATATAAVVGLLVENRRDLGVVDVCLVIPVETGVDYLGQALALDGLHGCGDDLLADADRVLRDRTEHQTALDRIDLSLA
jgi:CRP/FNR family cyclic AMP-dependent transcriptional regulator